jgi:voltage-gated potassium channel
VRTIAAGGDWRQRYNGFVKRHEIAWELTMAALAVVFVAVGFALDSASPATEAPLAVLDLVLTGVFVAEFASRLLAAPSWRDYLRGHWIDALALIPTVRGIRVLRLLRLLRLVRAFAGVYRALVGLERLAAYRGLIWLFLAWLTVAALSAAALYFAEVGQNPALDDPIDAVWWGIVTLSTVGYGDIFPVTPEGRAVGAVLMLLGITLWAGVTGTIASYFVTTDRSSTAPDAAATLLKLGEARAQGLITDEEFALKKQELLERI